jgi:nicotinamidase-related amidase
MKTIVAEPFDLAFDPEKSALVIIDMQRDFVLPGGFGEALGNDTALLLAAVEPCRRVLEASRAKAMLVVHTREGHRPDLTDCPPAKLTRGGKTFIGEDGPMGRILVRGEQGHDITRMVPWGRWQGSSALRCLSGLSRTATAATGPTAT